MIIFKKILPVIFIFLVSTMILDAQVYVGAGLGYGVPATPEPFGLKYDIATQDLSNNYGNVGQGIRANVVVGYMFNDNFGVELGTYYFNSPETLVQDTINVDKYYRTYTKSWHLRLAPALVFMAGSGKFTPYAKVGLCVPVAGLVNIRRDANDPLLVNESFSILNYESVTADRFDLRAEFKGQFSIGFESVAGLKYGLTDKLDLFGEVYITALRIKRATSEITKAEAIMSDGEQYDVLSLLSLGGVYQYTEFVDKVNRNEIQQNMADAQDVDVTLPNGVTLQSSAIEVLTGQRLTDYGTTPEKTHKLLVSDGSYNAIGINIGVKFNF